MLLVLPFFMCWLGPLASLIGTKMPATVPSTMLFTSGASLSPHHPTPLVNFTLIRPSEVTCPFSPVHWGGCRALISWGLCSRPIPAPIPFVKRIRLHWVLRPLRTHSWGWGKGHCYSNWEGNRKARGLQMEEIGCTCQTFFYLSLKRQKETNYKCQIFCPSLYKSKRRFLFLFSQTLGW